MHLEMCVQFSSVLTVALKEQTDASHTKHLCLLPLSFSACLELGVHFAFRILSHLSRGYGQTQNTGTQVTLDPVSRAVSPDA